MKNYRVQSIIGVENDLIQQLDCHLSEERILLYVAMSRSKEYLFLTWASARRGPIRLFAVNIAVTLF